MRRGGAECVYRLDVAPAAQSAFSVTTEAHSVRVEAGKSADLKLTVTRPPGDDVALAVNVTGLPDGVTATSPEVPAKGGSVTVTFKADADAKPANGPFRVTVVSKDEKRPAERNAEFSLGTDQLVRKTDALWLTVVRPDKAK